MCIESRADSYIIGPSTSYTVTVNTSKERAGLSNHSKVFNVFKSENSAIDNFGIYHDTDVTYFDFYDLISSAIITPEAGWDGFYVSLSSVSYSKFDVKNVFSYMLAFGSVTSVANDTASCFTLTTQDRPTSFFYSYAENGLSPCYLYLKCLNAQIFHSETQAGTNPSLLSDSYPSYDLNFTITFDIAPYRSSSVSSSDISKQTDDITNAQDQTTDAVKEVNETNKGIWASLKDFFGSFFQNLLDLITDFFIPSAQEMESAVNQLNTFFNQKFGFLYAPFNYFIQLCNALLTDSGSTSLTFPGFSIMGYEVWSDQTYDLADAPLVMSICGYVRIGTGVLLMGYFISYLQRFFKERFGSGGN